MTKKLFIPANPDATNSELDAKKIVKNVQLTSLQWDELIEQYVQLQVDSMDYESLEQFVIQTLTQDLREIESREELCDEIKYTFDEETLDELVDNVTNETVLDTNNTGGKF